MGLKNTTLALFAFAMLSGSAFAACARQGDPCNGNGDCAGYLCDLGSGTCTCNPVGSPAGGACASYGEAYTAARDCCTGLVRDTASGKCNQAAGTCDYLPNAYVPPPLPALAQGTGGPVQLIENLEHGAGIAGQGGSSALGSSSNLYDVGWFSSWQTVGIIGVAVAIAMIAIAAMVGHGFNLPEVKAFVDAELMQAVVSILLIFAIIGLITFFDQVAKLATSSLPIGCGSSEPCYVTSAKFYISNLYDTADMYARNELSNAVHSQAIATEGVSTQFNLWWLAFAGTSFRLNAGESMNAERSSAIFETTSKLMASLYAQKFFIDAAFYGVAPVLLLLGILLRTFFFTRRLGGLLLAIAVALFIIYPLSYAFAWYTLNVTVYGERMFGGAGPACPAECTARYPVAFYVQPQGGRIVGFETIQQVLSAGINKTNWATGGPGAAFPGLVACRDLAAIGLPDAVAPNQCNGCPDYCRETPFPSTLPGCGIAACSSCNPGCKLLRQRTDCASQCNMTQCAANCRTKTPAENRCFDKLENPAPSATHDYTQADLSVSCSGCDGCPSWCRILKLKADGTTELLYKDEAGCDKPSCRTPGLSADGTCPAGCMYKTPVGSTSKCNDVCSYNGVICPPFCRVNGTAYNPPDISRWDNTTDRILPICQDPQILEACQNCAGTDCVASIPDAPPQFCAPYPDNLHVSQNCNDCPEYCRWDDYQFITNASSGKFANYSITGTNGDPPIPFVCQQGLNGRLNCGGGACGLGCNAENRPDTGDPVPRLCRIFAQGDTAHPYACRLCPPQVRVNFTYTDATGKTSAGLAELIPALKCSNDYCNATDCKSADPQHIDVKEFNIPGPAASSCQDYNASYSYLEKRNPDGSPAFPQQCEMCLPFCRIMTSQSSGSPEGLDESLLKQACTKASEDRPVFCGLGTKDVCENPGFQSGYCCSEKLQCGDAPDLQTNSTNQSITGGTGTLSVPLRLPYYGGDPDYYWGFSASADLAPGESISWSASGKAGSGLSGSGLPADSSVGSVSFSNSGRKITVYKQICDNSGNCTTPACGLSTRKCNPDDAVCAYNQSTGACNNLTAVQCTKNTLKCSPDDTVCTYDQGTNTCKNAVDHEYTVYLSNITGMTVDYYGYSPGTKKCQACDSLISLHGSCGDNYTAGCCDPDYFDAATGTTGLTCDNYTRTCELKHVPINPCNAATDWTGMAHCQPSCEYPVNQGITCGEYLGNGPQCEGNSIFNYVDCKKHNESASCAAAPEGCRWREGSTCTGPPASPGFPGCESYGLENCTLHEIEGCKWQAANSITVPISLRGDYSESRYCSQCPEHCRLRKDGQPLESDCGIVDSNNNYIDCTTLKCPDVCRVDVPSSGSCDKSDSLTLQCEGCPVLCRRNPGNTPDEAALPDGKPDNICPTGTYCSYADTPYRRGCYESCRLPDAPTEACEACYDCPLDCTFYPAIRSDCSEVCTDEALSGPVNVGPTDFIKKLPGAEGQSDVKGVGVLMVPALVLPLFCIVMVISFIRVLSPMLGGDIEIPGLGRII